LNRYIQTAACCCILLAGASDLWAADAKSSFTLPQAIAEARAKNPEMLSLEAAVTSAQGDVVTAKTWANPNLTIEPGIRRALEDTSFVTAFNGVISLSQPFKFPGKRTLEIAIAQTDVKLREIAIEAFRFQMTAKVSRAFYEVLASQKIVEARNEQVASAKVFVESARKRAEGGYSGDFETIKSQADLIAAQAALREAEGQVATARIVLNTLMARSPTAQLELTGSLKNLIPKGRPSDFVGLALARNPALRALDIEAEKSGLTVRRTRMENLPDFAVGPNVEYYKDEQIYSISASLTPPLWDQKKGAIQTASAQQQQALAEIQRLRLEIAGGVTKAAAELGVAADQLALYPPALLDKMRAFVGQAEEGYAQSSTTLIIYLDAKRTYFDTLTNYYEALGRAAASRAELESAIGVPLDFKP